MSVERLERIRAAGIAGRKLEALIQEEREQTERLIEAAEAFEKAYDPFIQQRHERRGQLDGFDPADHLDKIAARLGSFCQLLREFGRGCEFNQLDREKLRGTFGVYYAEQESRASYDVAEQIFQAALAGTDINTLIRTGWNPPEPELQAARDALWFVCHFVRLLRGTANLKCFRRDLDAGAAAGLAEAIREDYARMSGWTASDLHRVGFDLDGLSIAVGYHGVQLPEPDQWKDSAETARAKLDHIISAIQRTGETGGSSRRNRGNKDRKKGKRGALARACELKRECPELERHEVADRIQCHPSLLANDRYRAVEEEVRQKQARQHVNCTFREVFELTAA